jgi:hypothetical protein
VRRPAYLSSISLPHGHCSPEILTPLHNKKYLKILPFILRYSLQHSYSKKNIKQDT